MISPFARIFTSYAYEVIDTAFDEDLLDSATGGNPGDPLFGALDRGRHIESRVSPTVVYNTVDNPFAPRNGMRITATFEVAGRPARRHDRLHPARRRSHPLHSAHAPHRVRPARAGRPGPPLRQHRQPALLPPLLPRRRNADPRRRHPHGRTARLRSGGRSAATSSCCSTRSTTSTSPAWCARSSSTTRARPTRRAIRSTSATLRTSSGVEMRVMMPVMNVPLRFIYAWNLYRDTFQPARTFKFAVGTTF